MCRDVPTTVDGGRETGLGNRELEGRTRHQKDSPRTLSRTYTELVRREPLRHLHLNQYVSNSVTFVKHKEQWPRHSRTGRLDWSRYRRIYHGYTVSRILSDSRLEKEVRTMGLVVEGFDSKRDWWQRKNRKFLHLRKPSQVYNPWVIKVVKNRVKNSYTTIFVVS